MLQSDVLYSIIVPTHERPSQLVECVRAIACLQDVDGGFELIVVNDGGATDIEPVVAQAAAGRISWRCYSQHNAGPAAARNAGVSHARGRLLAFTDDDCTPEPDWLSAMAPVLRSTPDAMVGGRVINRLTGSACPTASQQLIDYLYGYFDGRPARPRFFCSNNMAMSRAAFDRVGGFEVSLLRATAEDRELCDRWHHQGLPLIYESAARVGHAHAMTLIQFARQHFNYGRGAYYFRQARAATGRGDVRREPGAFYRGLIAHPFHDREVGHPVRQSALMIVSQAANVAGYCWQRIRCTELRPTPAEPGA